jgi:hypothetical protein
LKHNVKLTYSSKPFGFGGPEKSEYAEIPRCPNVGDYGDAKSIAEKLAEDQAFVREWKEAIDYEGTLFYAEFDLVWSEAVNRSSSLPRPTRILPSLQAMTAKVPPPGF